MPITPQQLVFLMQRRGIERQILERARMTSAHERLTLFAVQIEAPSNPDVDQLRTRQRSAYRRGMIGDNGHDLGEKK